MSKIQYCVYTEIVDEKRSSANAQTSSKSEQSLTMRTQAYTGMRYE